MNAAAIGADQLDGLQLNRAFKAGILRLLAQQEHLNKINVFPVPDGDTGTNLALTFGAVLGTLPRWVKNVCYRRLVPVGSALGVHGGPGLLVVAMQEYGGPP